MKIPNYDVKEVLGEGGMAIVYRATHQLLKQERAIKIMFSSLASEPAFEKSFLHEGQIVASLDHQNIVKIHDVGRCDKGYFMAMEYLTGGSLGDKIKKFPLSVEEGIFIIQQIGNALHYAHQQGLIHRDIKPNNIMFNQKGDAILTDFGISKLQDTESDLTRYGYGALGTPRYMSPEQTTDEVITQRSDIYSLALVFYEILAGKPGIEATTTVSIIREHVLSPPPAFPATYAYFQPVLDKALAKEPKERYATVKEFVDALVAKKVETENHETVIIHTPPIPTASIINKPISELKPDIPRENQNKTNKKFKIPLYLVVFILFFTGIGWWLIQSDLLPPKKNVENKNTLLATTSSSKIQAVNVNDSKEKEVVEKAPSSPLGCDSHSIDLKEGINCFYNGDFDTAKIIINKIIKNKKYTEDINKYTEPYLYLALIAIENNNTIDAIKNIKRIYFIDPYFNLDLYTIPNKYKLEFNKNISWKDGEMEFDNISNSNFIRVSTCSLPCVDGFWIGEKEISQQQWYDIISKKENIISKENPICDITWDQANQFAKKVKKRLCATEEWLKALNTIEPDSYQNAVINQSGWSPSSINAGEKGKTGITNLIGNVMEFTINKNKPAYMGLYWTQMPDGLILNEIKTSSKKGTLKTKSFNIGIRLCHSAG